MFFTISNIHTYNNNFLNVSGMVFHNLSDISEHSPSRSGHPTTDLSKDSGAGDSPSTNGYVFSPSRSAPYKCLQTNNSKPDFMAGKETLFDVLFHDNSKCSV